MTPTDQLRNRLRRLLDERIPAGGSDADTRFSDDDIDALLVEACCVYGAASVGWTEKAGMLRGELGDVKRTTAGQETYEYRSLRDLLEHALKMAQHYADLDKCDDGDGDGGAAFLLNVARPRVL